MTEGMWAPDASEGPSDRVRTGGFCSFDPPRGLGRHRSEVKTLSEAAVDLCGSQYPQAKACKKRPLSSQLQNSAAGPGTREGWAISYLTAQKKRLDLFDFDAGEDRAM